MRKKVIITDPMQHGYVYCGTEPVGRNFAPGFTPDLTPKEMLRLGIFGGKGHDPLPGGVSTELSCSRQAVRRAA